MARILNYFNVSVNKEYQNCVQNNELSCSKSQVLTLRTVHEQLVRLLSQSERQQLRTADAFTPFSGLNPLHQNPYTEPLWRAAVSQYERGMAPAEQKIAGKLRQQFRDLSAQSHQVSRGIIVKVIQMNLAVTTFVNHYHLCHKYHHHYHHYNISLSSW